MPLCDVDAQIPRGCQPNTVLQMRGKGIKELNSNRRGSQLVNLQVEVPKYVCIRCVRVRVAMIEMLTLCLSLVRGCRTLSPRQEELMQEFLKEEQERAEKGESDSKSHSFGATVRETVDRIKKFIKTKTAATEESS